ncbi:DUF4861 family protein [Psychrosphaera sp. 1_MG-2023]|uniref:DUF4861 family protein n=1 Tax=Psychrosphaera sp. 1_MG-2023 TaxID=3062643 RepID=UPI0026E3616C|nr:DUF4861 family protein [Psychrosphaera sp. 1_MG-2023]MDO6719138.1 DUF4861 family protein [Psychrosphaera sp. 1_MG-2023]
MTSYTYKTMLVISIFISGLAIASGPSKWQKIEYITKNNLPITRDNAEICLPQSRLPFAIESIFAFVNNSQIPTQITDCNGDQIANEILLLVDFEANQSRTVTLYHNPNVGANNNTNIRTQTELAVRVGGTPGKDNKLQDGQYFSVTNYTLPEQHFVGDRLFKYEGIGIESNQIAYRYYFDYRGSMDVFGKTTTKLVLPIVGVDGSNYHELSEWGMDVLKVGASFGIGTPGNWHQGQLTKMSAFDDLKVQLSNGVNTAQFTLQFSNWSTPAGTTDATVSYSMNHGDAKVKVVAKSALELPKWVTGFVNHNLDLLQPATINSKGWAYIASYGKQSLAGDNLGLAVFYKLTDRLENSAGIQISQDNQAVVLNSQNNMVSYYFMADWQGGINGSATQERFIERLEQEVQMLNSPISITLTNQ